MSMSMSMCEQGHDSCARHGAKRTIFVFAEKAPGRPKKPAAAEMELRTELRAALIPPDTELRRCCVADDMMGVGCQNAMLQQLKLKGTFGTVCGISV